MLTTDVLRDRLSVVGLHVTAGPEATVMVGGKGPWRVALVTVASVPTEGGHRQVDGVAAGG